MMDIDTFKAAKDYYESLGYTYLSDIAWDCPEEVQQMTIPEGRNIKPSLLDGKLPMVGSAEQSFLHMILQGKMPKGYHQAITPCFRNDQNDAIHQLYFMKLELIHYWGGGYFADLTLKIASDALVFFNKYVKAEIIKTNIGYDIVSENRIELGSYGNRSFGKEIYTYGTGLAQPRLNYAIQLSERQRKNNSLLWSGICPGKG